MLITLVLNPRVNRRTRTNHTAKIVQREWSQGKGRCFGWRGSDRRSKSCSSSRGSSVRVKGRELLQVLFVLLFVAVAAAHAGRASSERGERASAGTRGSFCDTTFCAHWFFVLWFVAHNTEGEEVLSLPCVGVFWLGQALCGGRWGWSIREHRKRFRFAAVELGDAAPAEGNQLQVSINLETWKMLYKLVAT